MPSNRQRAFSIAFFAALIVCAAVVYSQLSRRKAEPPPRPAATPLPSALPAPKLAAPPAAHDAGPRAKVAEPLGTAHGLLLQIRALVRSDPARAEALARESRRRFPDGAEADERDALLVDALVNQQRIGAARDETYFYFEHHPNGRFAEHLAMMTGVHPAPTRPGP